MQIRHETENTFIKKLWFLKPSRLSGKVLAIYKLDKKHSNGCSL